MYLLCADSKRSQNNCYDNDNPDKLSGGHLLAAQCPVQKSCYNHISEAGNDGIQQVAQVLCQVSDGPGVSDVDIYSRSNHGSQNDDTQDRASLGQVS